MFAKQNKVVESQSAQATNNTGLAALMPLFWEMGNLKRVRAANLKTSVATNLFLQAWGAIDHGALPTNVAVKITAAAVAAAQLGAINVEVLNQAALPPEKIQIILERSFDLSAASISKDLRAELRANLIREFEPNQLSVPVFARNLAVQPRSGATKPGAAKLVFDAPENHAEHCITVAIYAVLLAPVFGANIETVFLAALAHHFHNAYLPDSGFAGEELLGEFLPIIFKNLREKCLAELPENLRESVRQTFILIEHAETPEAKAFHAADVIDRVLQMRHHAEINEFTLKYALEEQELVHAGAIQKFHYEVLQQAKLI